MCSLPHSDACDRRTRPRQRGNTTNDQSYGIGIGIGIALVEAILEADREQVHLISNLCGTAESIVALAAAERRALFLSEGITTDGLFDLADMHQREHSYRSMIIRARDRFGIWSPAVRFARGHSKRQLQHHFHASTGRAERLDRPAAPSGASRGVAAVFGAGYATALTIVHLAAVGEKDWTELLTDLRAHIALELVLPPEVMPPA